MDTPYPSLSTMHANWVCIALLIPALAQADELEDRMQRCEWGLSTIYMPQFQQARKRLPGEIKAVLKSCDAGGPTYQLQAKQRTVELQDSWLEGERSTAYVFSSVQAAPGYWTFDYLGYEWSGVTFINRRTGEGANTPCNQVASMHYNPSGDRAVFLCTPEYGEDPVELYAVVLIGKPRFVRLSARTPVSRISVVWKSNALVTVRFHDGAHKVWGHQYDLDF